MLNYGDIFYNEVFYIRDAFELSLISCLKAYDYLLKKALLYDFFLS